MRPVATLRLESDSSVGDYSLQPIMGKPAPLPPPPPLPLKPKSLSHSPANKSARALASTSLTPAAAATGLSFSNSMVIRPLKSKRLARLEEAEAMASLSASTVHSVDMAVGPARRLDSSVDSSVVNFAEPPSLPQQRPRGRQVDFIEYMRGSLHKTSGLQSSLIRDLSTYSLGKMTDSS